MVWGGGERLALSQEFRLESVLLAKLALFEHNIAMDLYSFLKTVSWIYTRQGARTGSIEWCE